MCKGWWRGTGAFTRLWLRNYDRALRGQYTDRRKALGRKTDLNLNVKRVVNFALLEHSNNFASLVPKHDLPGDRYPCILWEGNETKSGQQWLAARL